MRTILLLVIVLLGACSRDACDVAEADARLDIPDCNPDHWSGSAGAARHDQWGHSADWFWTYDVCINNEIVRLQDECRAQDTGTAADTGLNP